MRIGNRGRRTGRGWVSRARQRLRRPVIEALEDRLLLTAGDLDSSFAADGKAALDFTLPNRTASSAFQAVDVQADGRVVAVGRAAVNVNSRYDPDLALARYNTDGTSDATFGTLGRTVSDLSDEEDLRGRDEAM